MSKAAKREKGLKFGDEVLYKNNKCVVLESFSCGEIDYYHIFGPQTGVYTAYEDEVKKIGHSKEAENLLSALNNKALKETA